MRNLKLTIQYDGTDYAGWQRQPNGVSIQGLLEDALAPIEGAAVAVHGAGRTDAGVHALAQAANVKVANALDTQVLARALNAVLPADVRILGVEEVAPDFHARFSAVAKTYEYQIINAPIVSAFLHRYVWHVPQPLDVEAMRAAAAPLVGRHDFAGFQGAGSDVATTERTLMDVEIEDGGGFDLPVVLRIRGDGFLRHMVRAIVGTLAEIGAGSRQVDSIAEMLRARDRQAAGATAPPQGLTLISVRY